MLTSTISIKNVKAIKKTSVSTVITNHMRKQWSQILKHFM